MQIYTSIQFTPAQQRNLRELVGPHGITFANHDESDRAKFDAAQIVFGSVPPNWLAEARLLRWLQLNSTGIGQYLHLDWNKLGKTITVSNLAGFFAEPVAETAVAGLLALQRGIDRLVRLQTQRHWDCPKIRSQLRPLHHAVVLIAGYGAIGRRIAAMLAPFDCEIISFARHARDANIRTSDELDGALPRCDIVIAAMPQTRGTIGLFDAARLARFKQGAVFVNVGRGSAVVEPALLSSLQSGRLAGAVLDVTAVEPLPPDHPLWSAPNCLLTQHTAGGAEDELDRTIRFFTDNLQRYQSGKPLMSVVDWEKGY